MNREEIRKYLLRVIELDKSVHWEKNPRRELKLLLLKEFGTCFWCGKPVKDYGSTSEVRYNPPDMATIDHLESRFFRPKGKKVPKVLCCRKCNQQRSEKENKIYSPSKRQLKTTPRFQEVKV